MRSPNPLLGARPDENAGPSRSDLSPGPPAHDGLVHLDYLKGWCTGNEGVGDVGIRKIARVRGRRRKASEVIVPLGHGGARTPPVPGTGGRALKDLWLQCHLHVRRVALDEADEAAHSFPFRAGGERAEILEDVLRYYHDENFRLSLPTLG